jgi:hypothetical protein
MDEYFAQSREPDDLFSDEIEPSETEVTDDATIHQRLSPTSDETPTPASAPTRPEPTALFLNRSSHRGGRRGVFNGSSAKAQSENSTQKVPAAQQQATSVPIPHLKASGNEESRVASVRGDRSATGPAKPAKKTEAELTELMKAMQLKNAAKTEAHARAEQDQASFLQREKQAAMKVLEERRAIREQDMERAKNRERKIKAQGGREWDSDKQESDIVDRSRGNSSRYSRGAHGSVASSGRVGGGLAESRYAGDTSFDDTPYGGRGTRGGRGGGRANHQGGRGDNSRGGRGTHGRGNNSSSANTTTQTPAIKESDFPALPSVTTREPASTRLRDNNDKLTLSPRIEGSDWAEQMATPI